MRNGDAIIDFDFESCPVHDAPCVKEYDFGYGLGDATVYRFACGCCASTIGDSLDDCGVYHTTYAAAEGRARLGVALAR